MSRTSQHVFVTDAEPLRSNWRAAFPDARLIDGTAPLKECDGDLFWLMLPYEGDVGAVVLKWRQIAEKAPVIALSDEPRDEEGLLVFRAGASGYCNGYASPLVLQQVAETVAQGGVWLGQSLLQKIVMVTAREGPRPPEIPPQWAMLLTEREQTVALAVATGASNKEIADQLDITERTVKAHLTAIFEKLPVRDRLQLTLLVTGRM